MSATAVRGGQVFIEIGADPKKFFAALSGLQKRIGQMGSALTNLGGKMAGVGTALALPIGLAMRNFAQFDDAIRATAAVSQASASELQRLTEVARNLGATTSFTAVQVANLMTELGRAGFSPKEIENMTGAVLDLSRATGTDAALSAGIMAATLRQFGLGATEATRAADVLTATANKTFNTVEGLGESLKYAGPVAKELGLSLEDTAAILGVLGNVGIQGSEAGTALRRLGVISAASGEKLQELFGISNQDAAGNLKPLITILDEINDVTANMPVAERTKRMAEAFGLLGITSANVLSKSAGGVSDLAAVLRTAQGTAAKTAKEMDAGLGGSMRITLSAIEGTALAIGDALAPGLQKLVDFIGQVATAVTGFVKENEALVISFAKGVAIFTAAGLAIAGIGAALTLVSAAMAVVLSPVVLIVAGVAALGVAIAAMSGSLSGLSAIASTTFGSIYDAIVAGDLSGAMDALWAGLYAGWLRGTESLMGAVDPWISMFQNAFTILGAEIYKTWDWTWTSIAGAFNTVGAVIQGAMDNVINGVMAAWDRLEAGIRKSWNYIQSFFKKGMDLKEENNKVDSEMAARARKRELDRPGVEGRVDAADKENKRKKDEMWARQDAVDANTEATMAERNAANQSNADARRAATQAAESRATALGRGSREKRAMNQQAEDLGGLVAKAGTLDSLRELSDEFHTLTAAGRLTTEQQDKLAIAFDDATERIMGDGATIAAGKKEVDPQALADAAAAARASQAEVAGTFSSVGLGGMGFGGSLQQRIADAAEETARNTRGITDDGVVA
jgi:TP901 family phage tail tape measure protein